MDTVPEDVARQRLASSLPRWSVEDGQLVRTYRTGDWRRTNLLAGAIAFLAEAAYHHPDLEVGFPKLTVRLTSHDAGGITERDLELARLIEEHVTWRPGKDSVFTGPPEGWID
jgi:pterin-4a-carbinolamine dehydratase